MRIATICLTVGLLVTTAACTGDKGDTNDGVDPANAIDFGDKPLWKLAGGSDANQTDTQSGLEQIFDVRLVADQLILAGNDEDGSLNKKGQPAGTIVAFDIETAKKSWSVDSATPLRDDTNTTVAIGDGTEIWPANSDGKEAIAVSYAADPDTGSETGVALLDVEDGKLISQTQAAKNAQYVNIESVAGSNALVNVKKSDGDVTEAMMLDLAAEKQIWSRDGLSAVGMSKDAAILESVDDNGEPEFFEAVSRDTGRTMWDSKELVKGEAEVESVTTDFAIANSMEGASIIDAKTGEQLDVIDGGAVGPCVSGGDDTVACQELNKGIVGIASSSKSPEFTKIPNTDDLEITAVSADWVFTVERSTDDGTESAIDVAGNHMKTPGKIADMRDGYAVVHTGEMGGEVTSVSLYAAKSLSTSCLCCAGGYY